MATKATQPNSKTPVKSVDKPLAKPLVRASARSLHISPRKMRLVANLVKGMRASEAVTQLSFTNKKGAKYLARLIQSAVANAENNFSLKGEDMFVKSATCDMGQTMKRYFPRARGSAFVIRRKMTHVNIVLEEKTNVKAKKSRIAAILPKRGKQAKKTAVTKTQEGSIGEPEAIQESAGSEGKGGKVSEHKVKHQENTETTIREKSGDENQLKSN